MKYTIRTLHNGIWGPTGIDVSSYKEAVKFAKWGYTHYEKYKIVKASEGNLNKYRKSSLYFKHKKEVRV